jgi:hypothetical protein
VRALLATAGLLVLAGAAAAAPPAGHTLRKSPSGPIEAIAQDGSGVAWLTWGAKTKTCDAVHVLMPGKPDRSLPQPLGPGTMTCNWDLSDGVPQLALAAGVSTALWTLHENGPAPFDYVVSASLGGPEKQIARLAHAGDGTGKWLGDVAGAGKTLAYSWDDVEYVDKLACLSGGSCKMKIADGGINLVSRLDVTPLANAQPALQLAASAGRIAYIPATIAKAGRPLASANNSIYIVDATSGSVLSHPLVHGIPAAIALSPHVLAVLTQRGPHDRISWFSPTTGTKLGSALVSQLAVPTELAASDQLIVYRLGRTLYGISTATGRIRVLAKTGLNYLGLTLRNGLLVWAENHNATGKLRGLSTS